MPAQSFPETRKAPALTERTPALSLIKVPLPSLVQAITPMPPTRKSFISLTSKKESKPGLERQGLERHPPTPGGLAGSSHVRHVPWAPGRACIRAVAFPRSHEG